MKILISADTSCVINYGVLKKNNVSVFPLNVIIDEEEFLDGVTIDQNKLKDDMMLHPFSPSILYPWPQTTLI